MAQDRLAAMRMHRQNTSGETPINLSLSSSIRYSEGGIFLSEVTSIQDGIEHYNLNVRRISDLHSRSLDESSSLAFSTHLEDLRTETRALSTNLKDRIKALQKLARSGSDAQMRNGQVNLLRKKFMEAIQNYQQVEQLHRTKYKQRVERQFRIVKPEATKEEVSAVVNDEHGNGDRIFARALTASTRYHDSRAAYLEAQERHQDIKRMERTLAELAQLFTDVGILVEEQEVLVDEIEKTVEKVEVDIEKADVHIEKAVEHAASARRKRWIMFFIFLLVLAGIGIAVGVTVGKK